MEKVGKEKRHLMLFDVKCLLNTYFKFHAFGLNYLLFLFTLPENVLGKDSTNSIILGCL